MSSAKGDNTDALLSLAVSRGAPVPPLREGVLFFPDRDSAAREGRHGGISRGGRAGTPEWRTGCDHQHIPWEEADKERWGGGGEGGGKGGRGWGCQATGEY